MTMMEILLAVCAIAFLIALEWLYSVITSDKKIIERTRGEKNWSDISGHSRTNRNK